MIFAWEEDGFNHRISEKSNAYFSMQLGVQPAEKILLSIKDVIIT